jgi:GT2 family glycosyltransferase
MGGLGELFKQTSVIVCTVDRLADLERCLESLQRFRATVAEIIVVNNGPHLAAVEEVAKGRMARVVTEQRRGVSRARNAGIRAALGNFVAFVDDDTRATESWLPHLIAPLVDSAVDCVMGAVRAEDPSNPVHKAFEHLVCAGLPYAPKMLDARAAADRFPLRMAMNGFTMNAAFRRDVFERFGYFDERFGRGTRIGSGEDPDLFFNVLRHGGRILFEPRALVLHRWPTDWKALRRSVFQGGCGHGAILTKYFLEDPSLRAEVLRYVASRILRPKEHASPTSSETSIPRLPFLLGSLYGPLAFFLSRRK